ncbi:MAG: hypothetical protein ACRDDM_08575 [Paraclostridium sp.]
MLNLSNKKKVDMLQFENTRLEIKVSNLQKELEKLKKETQRQEDLLVDWQNSYKESIHEIAKLKNQLKQYNPNLKPRTKKISENDIKKIKELFNMKNHTYREISKITNWSTCTVSKVINGFYD